MATVADLYLITEGADVNPARLIHWLLNPYFNQGNFNGTFGATSAGPGTFSSIVVTTGGISVLGGGLTVVGSVSFSSLNNTPIGTTTPSTGSFTALTVTGLTGVMYANGAGVVTAATNAQLPTMTASVGGAVPNPPNNTTTFLRGDGTFAAPATMTATVGGLVPNPPNNTTTFLRGDGTFAAPTGGTGTVTTVSVVSANGFAGTVANATTTPAITLTTSITGILYGNGTSVAAATNAQLPTMTATVGGAVPTPPNNTTAFLRGDGTFSGSTGTGGTLAALNTFETFTKGQVGAFYTLTDGATITPDMSQANQFNLTIAGNRTLAVPTNAVAGQQGVINIYQDQTGSRTLAYAWIYSWAGGTAGSLSTPGCTRDLLAYSIDAYNSGTVTITIATPGVGTLTAHGFLSGQKCQLTTTGALPTGLSTATTYYLHVIDANTFHFCTSLANVAAGTYIATSGSQSGTQTITGGSITLALAKAVI